ncbi:glycosyltransferase [Mycobacterium sherrisii]|uniref:Glycosyltransferase n=1 Tax=Mycobacterium sherrisii TaxID=243061 RepID=A0A1E3SFD4_9MYCO|nr:nucleotide disphospho-sugar-binding domain-containing protein [Mycobacterium sherrisii]MCV7028311.1 glycosyltransferase [Mycobacterium sherrisii]ODR00288.1 glycosyltransferase [Mycobacterium sherrisii]ORW87360.1 glycosyltransferase [Mycobacterium sherrisii]
MKCVLVGYGSRGDVEPLAAAGRELMRRGHDVQMAVAPNMMAFVESAGLSAVAYGRDSREQMAFAADFVGKPQNPVTMWSDITEHLNQVKAEKTAALTPLAQGADLLVAAFNEQGVAANVAEYYDIPLGVLHYFPSRILESGALGPQVTKQTDDAQRRALGLPELPADPARAALDIQAYDELCLPGTAADWLEADAPQRFVGALTLGLPSAADDEVRAWISAGTAPIYFGFGSTPLGSPTETVAVIAEACARVGERALICMGPNDLPETADAHVKIVAEVNHAAIFPLCRAVVHHGGAGATAAGLRAGIPTLVLWFWLDQPLWASGVRQLKAGLGRGFMESTLDSVVADLRAVLAPECAERAREVAAMMTTPGESTARTADLLEEIAVERVTP